MPLWEIFHTRDAFSAQDQQGIAESVTSIYSTFLPKFYVSVLFSEFAASNIYVGGEPTSDFVRIKIDHIARSLDTDEVKERFLNAATRVLAPYTTSRALRWELSVVETPRDLWTINGIVPPPSNSEAEKKWKLENRASAY